jgi:hypothetical protein
MGRRTVSRRAQPFRRRHSNVARYLAPVGATLSVATALVGFFVAGESHEALKGLIGVVIALLGTTITLLLEVLLRIQERNRAWDAHGGLLMLLEDHPELTPLISATTRASIGTLAHSKVEHFRDEVGRVLYDTSLTLEELARGRLRSSPGTTDLFRYYYEHAEERVRAITDERDLGWWGSATGGAYLELNRASRAKKKERIIIVGDERTDGVMELIRDNDKAGVQVYVVRASRVTESELLVNLTLFDDAFLHQDLVNLKGNTVGYLWSENKTDVQRAGGIFSRLLAQAAPYPSHRDDKKSRLGARFKRVVCRQSETEDARDSREKPFIASVW